MSYDYSKLRGKIVEVFGSARNFANGMEWSETTCYKKMNSGVFWKQDEIEKATELLGISKDEITRYFFVLKV